MTQVDLQLVEQFAEELQEMLDHLDYDTDRRRSVYSVSSYSGRGMYGERCLSIRHTHGSDMDMAQALLECAQKPAFTVIAPLLKKPSKDSLGRGTVTYFPQLTL